MAGKRVETSGEADTQREGAQKRKGNSESVFDLRTLALNLVNLSGHCQKQARHGRWGGTKWNSLAQSYAA